MKLLNILLIVLGVILLQLLLVVGFIYISSFEVRTTNVNKYLQGHGQFDDMARSVLPPESALTQAETVSYEYARTLKWSLRSFNEGVFLELSYDASTYTQEKDRLDTAYAYYGDDVYRVGRYRVQSHSTKTPTFSIDGYHFRVVDWSSSPNYDVNYLALVAYHDEKNSICYLLFDQSHYAGSPSDVDYLVGVELPLNVPWKGVLKIGPGDGHY